jgi:hypothetical protein
MQLDNRKTLQQCKAREAQSGQREKKIDIPAWWSTDVGF